MHMLNQCKNKIASMYCKWPNQCCTEMVLIYWAWSNECSCKISACNENHLSGFKIFQSATRHQMPVFLVAIRTLFGLLLKVVFPCKSIPNYLIHILQAWQLNNQVRSKPRREVRKYPNIMFIVAWITSSHM